MEISLFRGQDLDILVLYYSQSLFLKFCASETCATRNNQVNSIYGNFVVKTSCTYCTVITSFNLMVLIMCHETSIFGDFVILANTYWKYCTV